MKPLALPISLLVLLACAGAVQAFQGREHLTAQEIDMVKDTQVLDKRIDIFIKAADRRMAALSNAGATKQTQKDNESWGEVTGSRAELIGDIAKIFDEAINKIEDVSSRDAENALVPKSLRKLAAAATRINEQLKPMETGMNDAELSGYEQFTEYAESIVQAANKLPPPQDKKSKSKADKTN